MQRCSAVSRPRVRDDGGVLPASLCCLLRGRQGQDSNVSLRPPATERYSGLRVDALDALSVGHGRRHRRLPLLLPPLPNASGQARPSVSSRVSGVASPFAAAVPVARWCWCQGRRVSRRAQHRRIQTRLQALSRANTPRYHDSLRRPQLHAFRASLPPIPFNVCCS